MDWASGCTDMPQRNWNNIPDLLRAMPMKLSVKMERSPTKRLWKRGWRDLVRFGLLMR